MLRKLLILSKGALFVLMAVSAHMAAVFLLPFPYSTVNILIIVTSLHILFQQKGTVVWFAFFSFLSVELYSSQPFGLQLLSGTLQALFVYWLAAYLFTNRSWLAAIALSATGLVVYRAVYTVSFIGFHVFVNNLSVPPVGTLLSLYGTELLMTAVGAASTFFLLTLILKKKHHSTQAQYI